MKWFKRILGKFLWGILSEVGSTNFPTTLDSYTTKSSGDTISESHVNNVQDAIEALEAKVGVNSSAITTSHDYKLRNLPTQDVTTVITSLNADLLDGAHKPTGDIVGTSDSQTLTNKTLTTPVINTPDINAGTVDAITSLTVANAVDIGSYDLRALSFTSDVTTGTAPLVVSSTTLVTNLNADKLDSQEGTYYLALANHTGSLPADAVTTASLKTATSEVSWNNGTEAMLTLTGGLYCHYPQTKLATAEITANFRISIQYSYQMTQYNIPSTYGTYIAAYNYSTWIGYAQSLYHTASGQDYWLWMLFNRFTEKFVLEASGEDHVAYGNSNDFEKQAHPFMSYNSFIHDIVLIEKFQAKEIKKEAKEKGLSVLELINNEYKVNFNKDYKYVPIHSGRFTPDREPVLVNNIPNYIKVKCLLPMTEEDKAKQERQELIF